MKTKQMYEAPEAELIELNLDANVMNSNSPGSAGSDDDVVDYGDF